MGCSRETLIRVNYVGDRLSAVEGGGAFDDDEKVSE